MNNDPSHYDRVDSHPIRLLVLAHDSGLGGAQRSLKEIVESLDAECFETTVMAPTPGPFVSAMRRRGLPCFWGLVQRWIFFDKTLSTETLVSRPWLIFTHPYIWVVLSWLSLPFRVLLLSIFAKAQGVQLVYTNTATVIDGALMARLLGLPHVWHLRESVHANTDLCFPGPVRWLPRFVLRASTIVITNSHYLRTELFGTTVADKVRVIHNGVDPRACCGKASVSPLLEIPEAGHLTAICGQLTQRKRVDFFLRAMGLLQASHPDLHHLVIGEGSDTITRQLKRTTEQLGMQDRVHFLGKRNDVLGLLKRADVAVSTSADEPFGRTLLESMSCETPVVATRSGGPEEVITDGETGFLVEIDDEEALAQRVAELLESPELKRALGQAAKREVETRFNVEHTVDAVARCLLDATGP